MKKQNWIWMAHAGHCIIGDKCRFHLATYVGKYIVSTIGEYDPDFMVKQIHAKVREPKWFELHKDKKGENFGYEFFKKFRYIEIGFNRTYETMVFKAKKSNEKCCPYVLISGESVDFKGYNDSKSAFNSHNKLCQKWSKK